MYHIRIEGEQDGAILDTQIDGFVIVMKRNEDSDEPLTNIRTRGLNAMEVLGMLHWALTSQADNTADESYAGDPLVDER